MKSSIQFQPTGKCAIPSSIELEQWEFSALAELNIRVHEQMNWSDSPNFDAMATIIPTRYKSGKSKSKPRACFFGYPPDPMLRPRVRGCPLGRMRIIGGPYWWELHTRVW